MVDLQDNPDLEKVRSSADQINNFMSSMVWRDFKDVIEGQLKQKYILLETVEEEGLKGLQEAIRALKFTLEIPEMLLEQKEDEPKDEEE